MEEHSPESGDSNDAHKNPPGRFASVVFKRLVGDKILFWILVLFFVAGDLWTKQIVVSHVHESAGERLPGGGSQVVWVCEPWFGFVSVENKGGPWGVGAGISDILKIVRFAALGVILYLLAATPRAARWQQLALAMIMGGAVGNIWDTMTFGSVRDFLYFDLGFPPADPWLAFNAADSFICTGVILLAAVFYFDWLRAKKEPSPSAAAGNREGSEV